MRTISREQLQALEDLSAQGLLNRLPLQTAEKDIHITALLKALSTLEVRHHHFSDLRRDEMDRADPGIQLVSAGGTCLSKAHRLIERMSEDIDINIRRHIPNSRAFDPSCSWKSSSGHHCYPRRKGPSATFMSLWPDCRPPYRCPLSAFPSRKPRPKKCYRCCDAPRTKGTDTSSTPWTEPWSGMFMT